MPDDLAIEPGAGQDVATLQTEIADLRKQLSDFISASKQAKDHAVYQSWKDETNGAEPKGRDRYAKILDAQFARAGYDSEDHNNKFWKDLLADYMHEALKGWKEENKWDEWRKNAETEIFTARDKAELANFLLDPANAGLKREIIPEVMKLYHRESLFNAPEGHQGEWNGIGEAYKRFKGLQNLGGEGQPGRPGPTRMPASSLTHPPEKRAEAGPSLGGADRFRKENPDLDAALKDGQGGLELLFPETEENYL